MLKLNREQLTALKRVYDREQNTLVSNVRYYAQTLLDYPHHTIENLKYLESSIEKMRDGTRTYLEFRRTVTFQYGDGCIMVESGGIYLGIESDGHTHS